MKSASSPPPAGASGAAVHLLVFLLFTALTIVGTWPMATELGTALPGEKMLGTWYLFRSLSTMPLTQWLSPTLSHLNYPDGGTVIVVAQPQFLLAWLLTPLLGSARALNVSLLLHIAFGGYAGWRLSRRVWGATSLGPWAHLSAGLVLGISSFALGVYANGQVENLGVGYVALAAEGLVAVARGGRARIITGVGVAVLLAFLSSPYLMMGFLLAAAPLALARAARRWQVAAAGAIILLLVALLSAHFSRTLPTGGARLFCPSVLSEDPDRRVEIDVHHLAAAAQDAGLASETAVFDLVWAVHPPVLAREKAHERLVGYLGWSAVGLAICGLWAAGPARGWLLLAIAAPLVLAMGPNLTLNGWALTSGGSVLRLPLYWLGRLPWVGHVFGTINVPVRLVIGVLLPWSLAVGRGVGAFPRAAPALFAVLVLDQMVLGPAHPPQNLWPIRTFGVYGDLAEHADDGGVLDTPPVGISTRPPSRPPNSFTRGLLADAWRHHHPTPYTGCYPPLYNQRVLDSRFPAAVQAVGQGTRGAEALVETVPDARALGFSWWVIHMGTGVQSADADARILAAARAAFREVAAEPDGTHLFAITP